MYRHVPEEIIVRIAGSCNAASVPIGAAIGVPLSIRAKTAIPIGLSLWTVIALIIGGDGMAISEISMLAGIFKKKLVGALAAGIGLTAVIGGPVFTLVS
ncbi:MAG: permease [Sphaerochaeta sp.]|nr:permease [Sphaerochaeta sp.]HAP57627.1 hypothetical protein [Sphaerochaeta sp.]